MENRLSSLAVRVRRGAALLDEQWGPSWHEEIDLDRLNLSSAAQCILGQLHGGYWNGTDRLGLTTAESAAHGFCEDRDSARYDLLTDAWRDFIQNRLDAEAGNFVVSEDTSPTYTVTRDQLVALVTRAMDSAPRRGDYSEVGLTYEFLRENNLL